MAQGGNSTSTGVRTSDQGFERKVGATTETEMSDKERVEHKANEDAKKGIRRMHSDEEKNADGSIFSK